MEIVERTTNQPIESSELRDEMILQMAILDGNTYDAKFEAGMEGDFESCILLMNNKVRRKKVLTRAPSLLLYAESDTLSVQCMCALLYLCAGGSWTRICPVAGGTVAGVKCEALVAGNTNSGGNSSLQ